MKFTITFLIVLFSSLSIIGQVDLMEKDRYCVTHRKLYDFNTGKKLKNKEALTLLSPYPDVYNRYKKSMKQKNIAYVSGAASILFAGYVAGSEDMKNESFGDYNTTQKLVSAGLVGSAIVMSTSLFMHEHNRTKSLIEADAIIKKGNSSSYDSDHNSEHSIVKLRVDPSRLGLSVTF